MMHPNTTISFINQEIGLGVTTTKFIPKGTITWVQDELDRIYSQEQLFNMAPVLQNLMDKYSFRNSKGEFILCWDLGKYVNHSFKSNCLSTAYNFEVAIRDIQKGEELTDDYGYLNVVQPFNAANEGTSREIVYPDDVLRKYKEWDGILKPLIAGLFEIDQPMMELLPAEIKTEITHIMEGKEKMRSTKNLYFNAEKENISD